MKNLSAAVVCIAVLYAADAVCFGGWYFACATKAIEQVCSLSW